MRIKINGEDIGNHKVTIETYEATTPQQFVIVLAGVMMCVRWWFQW